MDIILKSQSNLCSYRSSNTAADPPKPLLRFLWGHSSSRLEPKRNLRQFSVIERTDPGDPLIYSSEERLRSLDRSMQVLIFNEGADDNGML